MNASGSHGQHEMNCAEVASLLVFLSCQEVTTEEQAAMESHRRAARSAASNWRK